MSQLPENRTTGSTAAQHVVDHNEIHRLHNRLDGLAISVKAYGALGDSSTDDTTAIQAAINAQVGPVFFPPGTYITQPLTLQPGTTLLGTSAQAYYNATATIPNSATLSRLKLKAASSSPLISPNDGGTNLATACHIADLSFDCNGINQPAINLPDQGSGISRFWTIERCYVVNINSANTASGYALYIGAGNTACTLRDCIVFNGTGGGQAGFNAVGWQGSDGMMDNCYIGNFLGTGLNCLGGSASETVVIQGGGIFTCSSGVVVGGGNFVFDNVSIDHNFNDGVYIGNGPVTFNNCTFHTNSRTTTNNWSNITIDADNVQVNVTNCRATTLDTNATSNVVKYMIDTRGHTGVVLNAFGNNAMSGVTFGTGWSNYSGAVTAPSFPSSTVAATNTLGCDVQAFIANGTATITAITLGTTVTGMTIAASGTAVIRVPQGQTIKFTYASGSPSWTWVVS